MRNKILVMDTSILCCWLQVPGKETCGTADDRWDFQRIDQLIGLELKNESTIVLPLATIIETGNHIAQANQNRFECAKKLAEIIQATADHRSPWAAFSDQSTLWEREGLQRLATEWPNLASSKISIGDATFKTVAEFYAKFPGKQVVILTGDAGLKAFEPVAPQTVVPPSTPVPRRKKR